MRLRHLARVCEFPDKQCSLSILCLERRRQSFLT